MAVPLEPEPPKEDLSQKVTPKNVAKKVAPQKAKTKRLPPFEWKVMEKTMADPPVQQPSKQNQPKILTKPLPPIDFKALEKAMADPKIIFVE